MSDPYRFWLELNSVQVEALEAVLARVNEETNQALSDILLPVWDELRDERDSLYNRDEISGQFSDFRERRTGLVDTEAEPHEFVEYDIEDIPELE